MWSTANWRTAIAAHSVGGARGNAEVEEGFVEAGVARILAVLAVVVLAVVLAVLPALIALRIELATQAFGQVAVGIASLAVFVGGAKLAAAILGGARFALRPQERISSASVD